MGNHWFVLVNGRYRIPKEAILLLVGYIVFMPFPTILACVVAHAVFAGICVK
jgi:hypothetical protein